MAPYLHQFVEVVQKIHFFGAIYDHLQYIWGKFNIKASKNHILGQIRNFISKNKVTI